MNRHLIAVGWGNDGDIVFNSDFSQYFPGESGNGRVLGRMANILSNEIDFYFK